MIRRRFLELLPGAIAGTVAYAQDEIKGDVPYVPTPEEVVEEMLKLAEVTSADTVYDLGCGDGRIVVMAAKKYGAKAVGVDIDPERIAEANDNAKAAGVTGRVKFVESDLFKAEIAPATVVTLYLLTSVNERLKPKLLAELKPGTRVVSHQFDGMGDWKPKKKTTLGYRDVYLWVVPPRTAG